MSWNYENKPGSEYLNETEKSYLEKFGDEIDGQAKVVADNNDIDTEKEKEEYFTFMNELADNDGEYLVHGAPLRCTLHLEGKQMVKYNGVNIPSEPDEDSIAKMSKLQVTSEIRAKFGEFTPATVKDAMGGLRDEEAGLNIVSFGNCKYMEGRDLKSLIPELSVNASEEEIVKNMLSAIAGGKGTCYCCMKLNSEWENLPTSYDFATDSFDINISRVLSPYSVGVDLWMDNIRQTLASPYHMFDGEQGINTMSMLFCQRGGIIMAVESGQDDEEIDFVKPFLITDKTINPLGIPLYSGQTLNSSYTYVSLEEFERAKYDYIVRPRELANKAGNLYAYIHPLAAKKTDLAEGFKEEYHGSFTSNGIVCSTADNRIEIACRWGIATCDGEEWGATLAGKYIDIELSDGTVLACIMGDAKGNEGNSDDKGIVHDDGSIIEFLTLTDPGDNSINVSKEEIFHGCDMVGAYVYSELRLCDGKQYTYYFSDSIQ